MTKKIKIPQFQKILLEISSEDAEILRMVAKKKGVSRFVYLSSQFSKLAEREKKYIKELF